MRLTGAGFRYFFLLAISMYTLFTVRNGQAETLDRLHRNLPKTINIWTAEPEDHIYDEKTIFRYINGAAEVYRAYNMQQCLSRRYAADNAPGIVVDIFDMRRPEDAYGVFTHDTDGAPVDIGQGALYRPGWLSFWKHRFFVSIYAEEETEAAEKTVFALGKSVAALIEREGAKPGIVSRLPQDGLQANRIHYLYHPIILNYHFYVADENILNLTDRTDAVLASYRKGKETARLLLVVYPDGDAAAQSLQRFFKHYLPDADDDGISRLEDRKWAAAVARDSLLAVVLTSDSRQFAESLLKAVQ